MNLKEALNAARQLYFISLVQLFFHFDRCPFHIISSLLTSTALLLDPHPWQITLVPISLKKEKQLENFHRLPSSFPQSLRLLTYQHLLPYILSSHLFEYVNNPCSVCLSQFFHLCTRFYFFLTYSRKSYSSNAPLWLRSSFFLLKFHHLIRYKHAVISLMFQKILDLAFLISYCPVSLLPLQQTSWKSCHISVLVSLLPSSLCLL